MQTALTADELCMANALKLAKKALGWTSPNPMVGAVIVKNKKIIGQGYHRKAGAPHAEIEALKAVKTSLKGATLYVNLEPCAHYGKTPPCTDAIIRSGIKKVICSTLDPNPEVHGRGIAKLKQTGIAVSVGVKATEAKTLNEAFFAFHENRRPFIAVKFAASLDGKLATFTHDSQWITNDKARLYARKLRAEYQAILVGVNTVLKDDSHLGTRQTQAHDPLRIILDSKLRTPLNAQVLRDPNVIIATTSSAPQQAQRKFQRSGIAMLTFNELKIPLHKLMDELRKKEIISVMVEGGGDTIGSFVDAGLVDKVYAFYAPLLIGGTKAVTIGGEGAGKVKDALRLSNISSRQFEDNLLVTGYHHTTT